MDEIRRFMRFTLPGIVCILVLLVGLLISDFKSLKEYLSNLGDPKLNIGIIIGAFFASGGLGYLFSIIYFSIIWSSLLRKTFANDHRQILFDLRNKIEIMNVAEKPIHPESLTQREAWAIITQFWNANLEEDKVIKGVTSFINRTVDIVHSIGAIIIGTFIMLILWIYLHFFALQEASYNFRLNDFIVIFYWLLMLFLFIIDFQLTRKSIQSIINITIIDVIQQKASKKKKKIKLYFTK